MSPLLAAAIVLGGVAVLLILVLRFKLSAFFSLLVVALGVGVALGASPEASLKSIRDGMGGTVGFVGVVVGLGALFGAMLEAAGGVKTISTSLLNFTGEKRAGWALGIAGFLIAIPVFFDVAFIILVPLLYGLVRKTGRSILYYALPLLAGLGVTHTFIPPTPGPIAVADLLHADLGYVVLFGTLAGLPAMIIAGPFFASLLYSGKSGDVPAIAPMESRDEMPEGVKEATLLPALLITMLPLLLVLGGTFGKSLAPEGFWRDALNIAGHPFMALMIACGVAYCWLTFWLKAKPKDVSNALTKALEPAGAIVLVTGAGGAFKQVLVDTGSGAAIAGAIAQWGWPPLVFAFAASAIVRVAQGSATVAMITAASLLAPILSIQHLSAQMTALSVIAIASGACMASHVNDSGFWLVSRYLSLTEGETLRSWTVSSTIVAVVGIIMVLMLSLFVS